MLPRPRGPAGDRTTPPREDRPAGDDERDELYPEEDAPRPDATDRVQRDEADDGAEVHAREEVGRGASGFPPSFVARKPEVHRTPGDGGRLVLAEDAQAAPRERAGPRHHERVRSVVREQGEPLARSGTASGDGDEPPREGRVVQPDREIDHDRGDEEDGDGEARRRVVLPLVPDGEEERAQLGRDDGDPEPRAGGHVTDGERKATPKAS